MRFEEEIYTSAPKLLDGKEHLGVVGKSKGFPTLLETSLSFWNNYSIVTGIPLDAVEQHPPRINIALLGPKQEYYCISRTVYAGADHTGRTTPLAHHIVFAKEQFRAEGVSPAQVIARLNCAFKSAWQGPPSWIDPPRELPQTTEGQFPSDCWRLCKSIVEVRRVICMLSEKVLWFVKHHKPVVLVIPIDAARHVQTMIADVLSLLPIRVQLEIRCATHLIAETDHVREAALLVTYPNTEYVNKARNRVDSLSPYICDLTLHGASAREMGQYSGVLVEACEKQQLVHALQDLNLLWDNVAGDPSRLERVLQLKQALAGPLSTDQMHVVGEILACLDNTVLLGDYLKNWMNECVRRECQGVMSRSDYEVAYSILEDVRWPEEARKRILDAMSGEGQKLVSSLLRRLRGPEGKGLEELCRQLRILLRRSPEIVDHVIKGGNYSSEDIAALVELVEPVRWEKWIEWIDVALNYVGHRRQQVLRSIEEKLDSRDLSADTANALLQRVSLDRRLVRELPTDLLALVMSLSSKALKQPDADFPRITSVIVQTALLAGSEDKVLAQLHERYRNKINDKVFDGWAVAAANIGPEAKARFDRAVKANGLRSLAPVGQVYPLHPSHLAKQRAGTEPSPEVRQVRSFGHTPCLPLTDPGLNWSWWLSLCASAWLLCVFMCRWYHDLLPPFVEVSKIKLQLKPVSTGWREWGPCGSVGVFVVARILCRCRAWDETTAWLPLWTHRAVLVVLVCACVIALFNWLSVSLVQL